MADNKYAALVARLRGGTGLPVLQALMTEAADAIEELTGYNDCMVKAIDEYRRKRRDEREAKS